MLEPPLQCSDQNGKSFCYCKQKAKNIDQRGSVEELYSK
jgi:hypothetical protein